jgi:hypothetical protein
MVTGAGRLSFRQAEPPAASLHLPEAKSPGQTIKGPQSFFFQIGKEEAEEKTLCLEPLTIYPSPCSQAPRQKAKIRPSGTRFHAEVKRAGGYAAYVLPPDFDKNI